MADGRVRGTPENSLARLAFECFQEYPRPAPRHAVPGRLRQRGLKQLRSPEARRRHRELTEQLPDPERPPKAASFAKACRTSASSGAVSREGRRTLSKHS